MFVQSTADLRYSSDIKPVDHGYIHWQSRKRPIKVINGGVLLDLVIHKHLKGVGYWDTDSNGTNGIAQPQDVQQAILLCKIGDKGSKLVGLILHSWGDGFWSRMEIVPVDLFVSNYGFEKWKKTRHIIPFRESEYKLISVCCLVNITFLCLRC